MTEPLKIPRTVENLDGVQPPLRIFYAKADDGKFHLALDGEDEDLRTKLDTFRDNNRSLNAAKAELEAKVAELTTALKTTEGKAAGADEHAQKLTELEQQLQREREAHRETRLHALVSSAFIAFGGEPKAVDYVAQLAAKTFTVGEDGALHTTIVGEDGLPLTLEGWLRNQVTATPFVWKTSHGGGASHNGAPPPSTTPRVSGYDPLEVGRNAEGIAKGTIRVDY